MSGRGGRGGGRGGAGGRAVRDLMKDHLDDMGVSAPGVSADGSSGMSLHSDRLPPALYPQIDIPTPASISTDEMFCVQKMMDIQYRNESSPYYLKKPVVKNQQILRYSDRYKR